MKDKLKNVRQHFDHDAAKQILKEKYEAKMLFAAFEGMWKAGPELINTLKIEITGCYANMVLIDEYGNPCSVKRMELLSLAQQRWKEQMNGWHKEFEELQSKR